MKLCAVQIASELGDLERNLARHVQAIEVAAAHGADVIVFPELSLTGFAPSLAEELAMDNEDPRLDGLQAAAVSRSVTVGVGLPTRSGDGVRITMAGFGPGCGRWGHSKQLLHDDELPFFVPGDAQQVVSIDGHTLVPGICFETMQPHHAEAAAELGADVYLASVAKPADGVARAFLHYPAIARRHCMVVLMANAVGACEGFVNAGRSAVWNRTGELMASLDADIEGLLLFDTTSCAGRAVGL